MGYDFGIIKNTTDWEAFIESFNKCVAFIHFLNTIYLAVVITIFRCV